MKVLSGVPIGMNKATAELVDPENLEIQKKETISICAVYRFKDCNGHNVITCFDYRGEIIKIISYLLEYKGSKLTERKRAEKDLIIKALRLELKKPGILELYQSNGGSFYKVKIYPLINKKETAKLFSVTKIVNFQCPGFRMIHDNSVFGRFLQNKAGKTMLITVTDQEKILIIKTKDESRKHGNVYLLFDNSVKKTSWKELPRTIFAVSAGVNSISEGLPRTIVERKKVPA